MVLGALKMAYGRNKMLKVVRETRHGISVPMAGTAMTTTTIKTKTTKTGR